MEAVLSVVEAVILWSLMMILLWGSVGLCRILEELRQIRALLEKEPK